MGGERTAPAGGLAAWIVARWRQRRVRLMLLEKIALAPRQTVALVEADGRRFLVATSAEGSPAFYPLERDGRGRSGRVSW